MQVEKFADAFGNYINVTLRKVWNFTDNYAVDIDEERSVIYLRSFGIYHEKNLINLLSGSIDKVNYKKDFEKAIVPAIAKIFPDI